jgi:hypothetical protein
VSDGSGASGKQGLAIFRDTDWEDFVATVRYLPRIAREHGTEQAIAFGQTELGSLLALLGPSRPSTKHAALARAAVATFLDEGVLRLMADGDRAGFNLGTAFLAVVRHEYFEPSIPAVFERTIERDAPYRPTLPAREG